MNAGERPQARPLFRWLARVMAWVCFMLAVGVVLASVDDKPRVVGLCLFVGFVMWVIGRTGTGPPPRSRPPSPSGPTLSIEALGEILADSVAEMDEPERRLWDLIRVRPERWRQSPEGNLVGGGFWVVAVLGRRVIWWNEVEPGFNVTPYRQHGTIDGFGWSDDELHHLVHHIAHYLGTGEPYGQFDPARDPEPEAF